MKQLLSPRPDSTSSDANHSHPFGYAFWLDNGALERPSSVFQAPRGLSVVTITIRDELKSSAISRAARIGSSAKPRYVHSCLALGSLMDSITSFPSPFVTAIEMVSL